MQDLQRKAQEIEQYSAIIELCKDLLEHKKRDTKLLFIALTVSLLVNIVVAGAFLWYDSQWEYTDTITTTTEQSVDGNDGSIINGDQYNGESQNKSGGSK